jgi:hypothetical protein
MIPLVQEKLIILLNFYIGFISSRPAINFFNSYKRFLIPVKPPHPSPLPRKRGRGQGQGGKIKKEFSIQSN